MEVVEEERSMERRFGWRERRDEEEERRKW